MPASLDWNAIGAIAGVLAGFVVVGGAVVKVVKTWLETKSAPTHRLERLEKRLDRFEIRLFGLPADPQTGGRKVDGEFDRIDRRLEDLPDQIITALKNDG